MTFSGAPSQSFFSDTAAYQQAPLKQYGQFGAGAAPLALDKELLAGPLVAYRLWRLFRNGSDVWLQAISRNDVWPPGMPMNGGDPQPTGSVGVWAMRGIEDLRPDGYNAESDHGRFVCFLVGKVALWGKVIEHVKGYRAQYAYPIRVRPWESAAVMPGFPRGAGLTDTLRRVATAYGIEARA